MAELDETDRAIVARLQYDGRTPFTDIAAGIGVSEGAVRRRVKRLIDRGFLQIVGVVEPRLLDWQAPAIIGVTVESGEVDSVAHEIAQYPEVTYLVMASGGFDLLVEVYCKDREHLATFLNEKLQQIPGVQRTETFMILKMYKLSYRWGESESSRQTP